MSMAQLVKELREISGAGMMDCKKALEACDGNIDAAIDWLRENGITKAAKKGDRVAAEGLTKVFVEGNKAVIFELNSETDFVSKNEQFLDILERIGQGLVNSNVTTVEEALALEIDGETIEAITVNATATIGEKITFRRFSIVEKTDGQVFANYAHMGGRISVLALANGSDADTLRNISMHIAASNPLYLSENEIDAAVLEKEKDMLTKEALAEGKPANIVEKMIVGRLDKYKKEICLLDQPFVMDTDNKVSEVATKAGLELVSFARFEVGEGIVKEELDFAAEVAAQVASSK